MVVAVPARRVPTLYARTGEVVPLLALLFLVVAMARAVRSSGARQEA